MRQLLQNYRSGDISVANVPPPAMRERGVQVRTRYSLISAGTERATVEVAKKSLVGKARSRPDLVKKVIDTAQRIGLKQTYELVKNRLNRPGAMGYSLAGEVLAVGGEGPDLQPGDRVACAGVGYASHAEIVSIPRLLCVPVPDGVELEDAAYGALGAIALHGVRQAGVGLGDIVGVIGLGLVGQLAARILKAAGCRVFGVDLEEAPVELAQAADVQAMRRSDPGLSAKVEELTAGHGLDAVLVTAATDSSDPFDLACELLRDRGCITLLGNVRVDIPQSVHSELYQKEIEVCVGRSYGPGRYDPNYEERGEDYPYGYVRWTEQRNIAAFLQLIADEQLSVRDLTTHRFPLAEAEEAYDLITGDVEEADPYVGVLLEYPGPEEGAKRDPVPAPVSPKATATGSVDVGLIGAGNFGQTHILPHLQDDDRVNLRGVVTARGYTANDVAKKFDIEQAYESSEVLLEQEGIAAAYILTRHATHAELVVEALQSGKSVYVEKPLALDRQELRQILAALQQAEGSRLMVGYNRRFSPSARALKQALGEEGGPLTMLYRVNAGPLEPDSWYLDPEQGGRFIGEGGHFVDLCQFLVEAPITWVHTGCAPVPGRSPVQQDSLSVQFGFSDGSCATILYVSSGDAGLAKERLEVFGRGVSAVLDDFKTLTVYRGGQRDVVVGGGLLGGAQDKGYEEEQRACVSALCGEADVPIVLDSLVETSLATFAAVDSIRTGGRIDLDARAFMSEVSNGRHT